MLSTSIQPQSTMSFGALFVDHSSTIEVNGNDAAPQSKRAEAAEYDAFRDIARVSPYSLKYQLGHDTLSRELVSVLTFDDLTQEDAFKTELTDAGYRVHRTEHTAEDLQRLKSEEEGLVNLFAEISKLFLPKWESKTFDIVKGEIGYNAREYKFGKQQGNPFRI